MLPLYDLDERETKHTIEREGIGELTCTNYGVGSGYYRYILRRIVKPGHMVGVTRGNGKWPVRWPCLGMMQPLVEAGNVEYMETWKMRDEVKIECN